MKTMPRIETIEQLQAERIRLQAKAKEMEEKLHVDAKELSDRFHPLLLVFDFMRSGKVSSLFRNIFPLIQILGSLSSKKDKERRSGSTWGIIAGMALETILYRVDLSQIADWVVSKFTKKHEQEQEQEQIPPY